MEDKSQKIASPPSQTVLMAARSRTVRAGPSATGPSPGLTAEPECQECPEQGWHVASQALTNSRRDSELPIPSEDIAVVEFAAQRQPQGASRQRGGMRGAGLVSQAPFPRKVRYGPGVNVCGYDPRPCMLGQHRTVHATPFVPGPGEVGNCLCDIWVRVSKTV